MSEHAEERLNDDVYFKDFNFRHDTISILLARKIANMSDEFNSLSDMPAACLIRFENGRAVEIWEQQDFGKPSKVKLIYKKDN